MDRSPVERILMDWDEVTGRAQPPGVAPHRRASGLGGVSLVPLLAAALAVAIGVTWLGGRMGGAGGLGSAATPSPVTAPPSAPTASSSAIDATPPATAGGPCDPGRLVVVITSWDGAAGSRTATLTLKLDGVDGCTIDARWRPELVDGSGRVRIQGDIVRDTGTLDLRAGETLTTLAQASNDCQAPPQPPVTIAFVLADGSRVVARPVSSTDVTTPPCNGPDRPGTISMQPWTR